jgi:hypothetical protein
MFHSTLRAEIIDTLVPIALALALAGLFVACTSRCVPGRSASCPCPDQTDGAQVCGDDGNWGVCDCQTGAEGQQAGLIEDSTSKCVPGRVASCPCPGEPDGAQVCRDDGTWGTCAGVRGPYEVLLAEATADINAIRTAEKAYHAEWDVYTAASVTPPFLPPPEGTPFKGGGLLQFLNLGWTSDPLTVHCQYSVEDVHNGAPRDWFVVHGRCDLDGDGELAEIQANPDYKAKQITPDDVW